jgi:hypothetical protein
LFRRNLLVIGFSCAMGPDLMHGFASLSDTTIYGIQPIALRRRIVRIADHSGVDLCRIMYTDFPVSTFPEGR